MNDSLEGLFRFATMIGGAAIAAYLILAALEATTGLFAGVPKTPLKELNLSGVKKPLTP